MSPAEEPRCRACGAPVMWAKTPNGKWMPLDPDPYSGNVILLPPDGSNIPKVEIRNRSAYTSHLATCNSGQRRS